MSEMEKEALKNRIAAMTPEEQKMAVTLIDTDLLWDELRKRETSARNHVKAMKDLMVNVCV